jgi:hypothetical protein
MPAHTDIKARTETPFHGLETCQKIWAENVTNRQRFLIPALVGGALGLAVMLQRALTARIFSEQARHLSGKGLRVARWCE